MQNRPIYRSRKRRSPDGSFVGQLIALSLLAGFLTWNLTPFIISISSVVSKTPEEIARIERSAYYSGCNAARAAGVAPIYRGQPGYRTEMDGDLDGIACEPYYGR